MTRDLANLRFVRWAEPQEDGTVLFEAITPEGRVILAESLDLLLCEAWEGRVVLLARAA